MGTSIGQQPTQAYPGAVYSGNLPVPSGSPLANGSSIHPYNPTPWLPMVSGEELEAINGTLPSYNAGNTNPYNPYQEAMSSTLPTGGTNFIGGNSASTYNPLGGTMNPDADIPSGQPPLTGVPGVGVGGTPPPVYYQSWPGTGPTIGEDPITPYTGGYGSYLPRATPTALIPANTTTAPAGASPVGAGYWLQGMGGAEPSWVPETTASLYGAPTTGREYYYYGTAPGQYAMDAAYGQLDPAVLNAWAQQYGYPDFGRMSYVHSYFPTSAMPAFPFGPNTQTEAEWQAQVQRNQAQLASGDPEYSYVTSDPAEMALVGKGAFANPPRPSIVVSNEPHAGYAAALAAGQPEVNATQSTPAASTEYNNVARVLMGLQPLIPSRFAGNFAGD